jgi:hypothetical protein
MLRKYAQKLLSRFGDTNDDVETNSYASSEDESLASSEGEVVKN